MKCIKPDIATAKCTSLCRNKSDRAIGAESCFLRRQSGTGSVVWQWKREFFVQHLQCAWAAGGVVGHRLNLQHLDRGPTSSMTSTHLHVHLFYSPGHCHISVFLVHVHGIGARLVAKPYSKVLHLGRIRFKYFADRENFAVGFLHALQLPQEVPKTRFRDDSVRRKNPHSVHRSFLRCLRSIAAALWDHTAHDMILVQPSHFIQQTMRCTMASLIAVTIRPKLADHTRNRFDHPRRKRQGTPTANDVVDSVNHICEAYTQGHIYY